MKRRRTIVLLAALALTQADSPQADTQHVASLRVGLRVISECLIERLPFGHVDRSCREQSLVHRLGGGEQESEVQVIVEF